MKKTSPILTIPSQKFSWKNKLAKPVKALDVVVNAAQQTTQCHHLSLPFKHLPLNQAPKLQIDTVLAAVSWRLISDVAITAWALTGTSGFHGHFLDLGQKSSNLRHSIEKSNEIVQRTKDCKWKAPFIAKIFFSNSSLPSLTCTELHGAKHWMYRYFPRKMLWNSAVCLS